MKPGYVRLLAWTEPALLAAAVLLLGGWSAVTLEARLYGVWQERRLERLGIWGAGRHAPAPGALEPPGVERAARPLARRTALRAAPVPAEDLVGRIEIPRLRLRAIVAEGVSSRTLRRAVGHLPGTALPGEDGNVVLAGHRDTFFRALKDVRPGDGVRLTTPGGRFDYVVETAEVVEPARTEVLDPVGEPVLTLVTCYPFYLVGNAPERFVVRARQVLPERAEGVP